MKGESAEISLFDVVVIVRGSWVAIFAITLVCGVAALTIALLMKPTYRVEVLLSPTTEGQQTGGSTLSRLAEQFAPLSGVIGGLGGSNAIDKEVRIATLQSRHLTDTFIRERNLLPALFAERWDGDKRAWKEKDGKSRAPTVEEGFRRFDEKVRSVSEDRKTGLVTLVIEWSDPQAAAAWANELVARANEYMRERAIAEAQRSTAYLEGELAKTGVVERQQIIYRLIESKTSDIMMANARPEFAFEIVDAAVPPDSDNFVRPKRAIIVLIGLIAGMIIGVGFAILRWGRRSLGARPDAQAGASI